jgi:phosphoribosyl 1,2-cyclic phosphodiesterase
MRVKFWGTGGSFGLFSPERARYGCNTLCLEITSECLPPGHHLYVDSGTGIIAASREFMRREGRALTILQSHYHVDHVVGFPGSLFPYYKDFAITFVGPGEYGKGPREVMAGLMQPPLFPVPFPEVGSHIDHHVVDFPSTEVVVFHPMMRMAILSVEDYERRLQRGGGVAFEGATVPANECLVVRMTRTNHPEKTIGYRFEEGPTGGTLVTLFDHENVDSISQALKDHARDADLLIQDCQYDQKVYCGERGSWGHGDPEGVRRIAHYGQVKAVALIHHDPFATDKEIDGHVEEVRVGGTGRDEKLTIPVFAAGDYLEVEIGNPKTYPV